MSETTFLTAAELADRLKVTRRTIYRLVKEDRIPKTRIGGQWRFDWSQVSHSIQDYPTPRNPSSKR